MRRPCHSSRASSHSQRRARAKLGSSGPHGGAKLRVRTLILPFADVTDHALLGIETVDGVIVGPRLRRIQEQLAKLARVSPVVMINGASGAGKELAAEVYHRARAEAVGSSLLPAKRPFVALNCATIPEGLAERVLFGARRGSDRLVQFPVSVSMVHPI